jgi:hypothetical protein
VSSFLSERNHVFVCTNEANSREMPGIVSALVYVAFSNQ